MLTLLHWLLVICSEELNNGCCPAVQTIADSESEALLYWKFLRCVQMCL